MAEVIDFVEYRKNLGLEVDTETLDEAIQIMIETDSEECVGDFIANNFESILKDLLKLPWFGKLALKAGIRSRLNRNARVS